MPIIRSISGLRATISDGCLSSDLIKDYIIALTNCIPDGLIVLGRDGRPTGKWIEDEIIKLLTDLGWNVCSLGIVPTPTIQLITENKNAACGIVITASHNPADWNGMKFINREGVFFDSNQNAQLWYYLDNKIEPKKIAKTKGKVDYLSSAIDFHINKIMELPLFDNIKENSLLTTVDAVNSSGSVAVPKLLEKLGCSINPLYCNETGEFPHTPEPLPENLGDLCNAVRKSNSEIGFAVDPDADRLVLIDEQGNPIGEENTIVLAVWSVLENSIDSSKVSIVVNHSTTQTVEEIAAKYSAKVYRSPVGEINVVQKMQATSAIIGGEGSGGVIYAPLHYGRDSLIGITLVLALMRKLDRKLSELNEMLPKNVMLKSKMPFSGDYAQLIEKIRLEYKDKEINTEDGLKIFFGNSWVQIRKSNTEPIIRIIAEAKSREIAESLIKNLENIIK